LSVPEAEARLRLPPGKVRPLFLLERPASWATAQGLDPGGRAEGKGKGGGKKRRSSSAHAATLRTETFGRPVEDGPDAGLGRDVGRDGEHLDDRCCCCCWLDRRRRRRRTASGRLVELGLPAADEDEVEARVGRCCCEGEGGRPADPCGSRAGGREDGGSVRSAGDPGEDRRRRGMNGRTGGGAGDDDDAAWGGGHRQGRGERGSEGVREWPAAGSVGRPLLKGRPARTGPHGRARPAGRPARPSGRPSQPSQPASPPARPAEARVLTRRRRRRRRRRRPPPRLGRSLRSPKPTSTALVGEEGWRGAQGQPDGGLASVLSALARRLGGGRANGMRTQKMLSVVL